MSGVWAIIRRVSPALSLIGALLFFWIIAPDRPLSIMDARTILLQASIVCIVALGMTLVIAGGGIDLSVGSSVALAGVIAAKMLYTSDRSAGEPSAMHVTLAILAAVATGTVCGLYNGLLITALRLPPFIATLGTLGFFRGVSKWISGSSPVYSRDGWLEHWVKPTPEAAWLLVAPVVWLALVLALIAAFLLHRTVFGRQALAIGDHEEAARRCGVPITKVKLGLYAFCGLLAGIAGVIQFARLGGSGDPTIQAGLELRAIAAAVIGGASLAGGRASITGTVCGTLLMALLDNRCTALGWPNYVQDMVVGHIIIIAVAIDRWRGR